MAKRNIKDFAQKAIAGAEDGIQKAAEAAKKAASGVNDGFDAAKASVQKSTYANKVSKGINTYIKQLEKEKKTSTSEAIQDYTSDLIEQLKELTNTIKESPYDCEEAIETELAGISWVLKNMIESSKSNDEMVALTVMSKRYGDAIKACRQSLQVILDEKSQL